MDNAKTSNLLLLKIVVILMEKKQLTNPRPQNIDYLKYHCNKHKAFVN